jgi:hypothetical protein
MNTAISSFAPGPIIMMMISISSTSAEGRGLKSKAVVVFLYAYLYPYLQSEAIFSSGHMGPFLREGDPTTYTLYLQCLHTRRLAS